MTQAWPEPTACSRRTGSTRLGGNAPRACTSLTRGLTPFDKDFYEKEYLPAHEEKFGKPLTEFHAYAFDAMSLLADAIEAVAIEGEGGGLRIPRTALKDELFATEGFEGITGVTLPRLARSGAGFSEELSGVLGRQAHLKADRSEDRTGRRVDSSNYR